MDDLKSASATAASGMKAQSNKDSTALTPGGLPYQRKVVTFGQVLDRETGTRKVQVTGVARDKSDFQRKYDPTHPAADADGYVLTPNVSALVEMTDLKEAQRSYEANMSVVETARSLRSSTLDLLR